MWGVIGVLTSFTLPSWVFANELATVVQVQGRVQVFSDAAAKPEGEGPHVLYEGAYYRSQRARVGSKVKSGSVVQTGPGARARMVFPNGDHFAVGQGTSYKFVWSDQGSQKNQPQVADLKLYYGKVRAMVSPQGPRSGMRVQTQAAVAGVRGTDFFISHYSQQGTSLKVLRGEVMVKVNAPAGDEAKVGAGYTAQIAAPQEERPLEASTADKPPLLGENESTVPRQTPVEPSPMGEAPSAPGKIRLSEVTKEELLDVQRVSAEIQPDETLAKLTSGELSEQRQLLDLATKAVLEDIRRDNPERYTEMTQDKQVSLNDINTKVVADLYKTAPRAQVKSKPRAEELRGLGDEVYDKYFRKFDQ